MKTPITYIDDLLTESDARVAFEYLWDGLAWVRHDKVPRREYYVSKGGQPYAYGKAPFARTYVSQPLTPMLDRIWRVLEHRTGVRFDVVFLNGYEDGSDHLGWHSDDSPEMDDARPIAIVTLGQPRDIWFRERSDFAQSKPGFSADLGHEAYLLGHGSLCLMAPGMQDTHQHRIPKAGFAPCAPRISLTFRGYVEPDGAASASNGPG
jgi:alkylated DNA repair dioxygenase AlkB